MSYSVLNSFVLAYAPVTGAQRIPCAVHLCLTPVEAGAIDARHLLTVLEDIWPDQARLVLEIRDDGLLLDMLNQNAPGWLELLLPEAFGRASERLPVLEQARAAGHRLLWAGDAAASQQALPSGARPADGRVLDFSQVRDGVQTRLQARDLCTGISCRTQAVQCLDGGAGGIIGWPSADVLHMLRGQIGPDEATLLRLIQMVEREATLDQIEQALLREPLLSWHLLRHFNAGGADAPVNSLRRGLMMMGYSALEQWLAGQQLPVAPSIDLRPVVRATVLRAQFMEHLVLAGAEDELSREIYFCGLFSSLDRMLGRPMQELLHGLPLSERVPDALIARAGPYHPFLDLVLASEGSDGCRVLGIAQDHAMDIGLVNRALLRTLAQATHWD